MVSAPAKADPTERPVSAAPSPWVVSPAWDGFWMHAGLWLWVAFTLIGWSTPGQRVFEALVASMFVIALLHSWGTTYAVMVSPLFARARAERFVHLRVVPAVIMLGSLGIGVGVATGPTFADGAGFRPVHAAFAAYLALFFLGHFWHFAQQDFGVLSLYRGRAKQLRDVDRRVDLWYARFTTLVVQPVVYLYALAALPWSQLVTDVAPAIETAVRPAAIGLLAVSLCTSVAMLAFEWSKPTRSIPRLFYLLTIALHPVALFMVPEGKGLYYVFAYLFSHWFIAIGLAMRINTRAAARAPDPRRGLALFAASLGAILLFSCTLHLLRPADLFTNADFRAIVGHGDVWLGLLLGFALGEQLLHYWCDRTLFLFRDPYVRENVGPLLAP